MSTCIFFRVEREGRWGPVALEDLTTEEVVRLVVVARAPEVTADLLIRLARRVQILQTTRRSVGAVPGPRAAHCPGVRGRRRLHGQVPVRGELRVLR